MTKNIKNIFIRAICLIFVCATFGFFFVACSKGEETGVKTVKSVASRNIISNLAPDSSLHYSQSKDSFTEKAAASGLIEMYIDKEKNSFCILETGSGSRWSALPLFEESGEMLQTEASIASVKVIGGTDIYYLNTQDNSLAFGKASYSLTDNGAAFSYDLFTDVKTAEKTLYEKSDIGFNVTVTVTLADGSAVVDVTHKNITGNPDAYIEEIELLNYFGAYNNSFEEDFLLVPDGSGAIIRTSVYDESFESVSFDVYGADPSAIETEKSTALVPAFGIKHGNGAFVSLIQKGDPIASINAHKSKNAGEYNRVSSSFLITPSVYENDTLYISKAFHESEISLCYRFLSGKNSTYAGLASACREQLIRNSVLSTGTVEPSDYLPFSLTLTGAINKSFGPLRYTSALTTFEQAGDMLVRMKNKGINNISVRYAGVFTGATDPRAAENAKILSKLGGTDGLSELYSYISAQKMNLFLDINLLTDSSGFSGAGAVDLRKNHSEFAVNNRVVDYMNETVKPGELRKLSKLSDVVSQVLTDTRYYSFSGFCFNDVGNLLYSDFSSGGMLRNEAANTIRKSISPLSTGHHTMAVGGNFYMLKNIDSVIDLPLKASAVQSGAYYSVPFVELILHGIVDYSGEPINADINIEESLLRYIEYGACPHFEWNYESVVNNTEDDPFYYDNTINTAAEFYTKANETLNDLRDARMTDHYEVTDGIFCTEYDTGTMIYVNYTDSEYPVLGAVVEARSFLRIN